MSIRGKTKFREWKVNEDRFCLENKDKEELYLQPRLMKLLLVLTENQNRVVKKDEIMNLVWDDVIVGDESLSKAVFDLRKFLEDNFSDAPKILTIRKLGYRLEYTSNREKNSNIHKPRLFAKRLLYGICILILLILVLRGLSY
jgi:DNA-binding winged helix-turn-helix (wHTH) protein